MPARTDLEALTRRLFASSLGTPEILSELESARLPPFVHVHLSLLLTRKPIEDAIRQRAPRTLKIHNRGSIRGALLIECVGHEHGEEQSQIVRVSPVKGLPAVSILGVSTFAQWKIAVDSNLERLRPAVYRPFLRHWELQAVFDRLETSLEPPDVIRLTRVSSLRRLMHRDSRRKYESGLAWTDRAVSDAFEQAREEMTYFRSVAFELCRRREHDSKLMSTGMLGYVSRDAHWSATSRHRWLYDIASTTVAERARQDQALAMDRSRGEGGQPARPILAELSDDVAVTDEDIPRIVRKLRDLEHAAVSVLHGNPYLRASIVDLIDGSSFDFVLASDRRIVIVPQLRATESAVTRLCRFIYDEIGEAEFVGAESVDGRQ
jgi:hypothetical protein